jgi:hypothetical protein
MGFQTWSRGFTPRDIVGYWLPRAVEVDIRIGDVIVSPGDYLVGDRDGLLRVPKAIAGRCRGAGAGRHRHREQGAHRDPRRRGSAAGLPAVRQVLTPAMSSDVPVPPRRGWLTANLVAQLGFGLLAMTICLPSMQDWATTFGASQASVQLTFSGYIAAYGGLQLVYGPLSDRIGRKPVLMLGLALAVLGSLLAAVAPSLWLLTAARVLQGAGTAAGMVVGARWCRTSSPGRIAPASWPMWA